MIDFEILEQFKTTNERLREICTAVAPSEGDAMDAECRARCLEDVKQREKWEKTIQSRLSEAISQNLASYQLFASADLAWDTSFLTKANVPLLMYAQGKVSVDTLVKSLVGTPDEDKFIKRDKDKNVTGIDLPRFVETQINIVRSFITRRVAAQANKYNNLWPCYGYDPRGTSQVAKLRADALSQRVDQMADDFGYRHHDTQVLRDMFLYPHVVDFVRGSWEIEKHLVRDEVAKETEDPDKIAVKDEIVREGVVFFAPHPSRVFWDTAHALSSINDDTGCEFIGYWDVRRWNDVANNSNFFNKDQVGFGTNLWSLYSSNNAYFSQYMSAIVPPVKAGDTAALNTRDNNIGVYSAELGDTSVFLASYRMKMIPKANGVGDYPFPVWVNFTVASDKTIVHAEILPSKPGAYLGYNEADSRLHNISFAHELMTYQDQLSNLFTNLLLSIQASCMKVFAINTDAVTDPAHIQQMRKHLQGCNWAGEPLVVEFSAKRMEALGLKPEAVFQIIEPRSGQDINSILTAIGQLLTTVEKLTSMSPAEQGQPAPREISATEVNEIAATTSAVYSFISDAVDEFRAAKKRIIYESLMACAQDDVQVSVVGRYSERVIKQAGFTVVADEAEEVRNPNGLRRHTIIGNKKNLIHNHIFTSRDGAERPVNTQSANTLVQLLQFVAAMPMILQAMGKEKLYNILNEIFRMSGAGVDLNLELEEGEDTSFGQDQMQQLQGVVQQLADAVKQTAAQVQGQEAVNQQQEQAIESLGQLAETVKKSALDIQQIMKRQDLMDQPPKESLSYKDVPPSVKAQMEAAAGYQPATPQERQLSSAE